ncbi:MAG: recombinase RecA [Euryarchaeota archaeon]|nr:recombinase RecA [Euryarchaeota archaeon]MBU4144895.1 recombinase RecA [Candidatus Thermoplasmatota archaeon]
MGHSMMKVPTGVADFDAIVKGGLPEGSVVLLMGDVGAGQHEFVYTSAFKLATVKEHPYMAESMLGTICNVEGLPEHICYVTFSRSKNDILREISEGFDSSFYNMLSRKIKFKDLSAHYYKKSLVPPSWTDGDNGGKLFAGTPKENVLEALIQYLDDVPANSMIVIDSLTDLVVSENIRIPELVNVLRGMQRAAKNWGGLIYIMLTKGIMDPREEQMLIDSVDGVLVFEWTKYHMSSKRQRYMYVEKFMSVLPHLDDIRIARFPTRVTAQSGMTVINMECIK